MQIFGSNIDLRKVDFLSVKKISERSRYRKDTEHLFYKTGAFTYFFRT